MLRFIDTLGYGVARLARNACLALLCVFSPVVAGAQQVVIGFGDSLTQGYGLPQDQGFVPQMESWLNANGADVRMINAGVSGDTTAGGKARIDWTLAEPADAIIIAFGGNDLLRGLPPEAAKENLDYILNAATSKGLRILLVGMTAPGNYGPDYKEAFDSMYPDLAAQYDVALYPSFFAAFEGMADVPGQLGDLIQPDGLHPSAKGVQSIVAHMGPYVLDVLGQ
ncbi:MAG: arylesterase [Planktomarina sp.]